MASEDGTKAKCGRRHAIAFCTMLALALVPLRASCHLAPWGAAEVAAEHQVSHGEGKSDPCCASLDDRALVNSVVPDLSSGAGAGPLVASPFTALILQASTDRPLRPAGAPPPARSYYARSARILR